MCMRLPVHVTTDTCLSRSQLELYDLRKSRIGPVRSSSSPLISSMTTLWPWYAKPMPSCRGLRIHHKVSRHRESHAYSTMVLQFKD